LSLFRFDDRTSWLLLAFTQRDFRSDQTLDVTQLTSLVRRAKSDGNALSSRPSGSPNPMDVAFRIGRHVVVDHVRNTLDINATSRNVGCHHHLNFIFSERE
jgi:hypothetical protein